MPEDATTADPTRTREDVLLAEAEGKGTLGKAAIYTRLSGPGWLQGAITLGGGSLAGALYLGVIMGYEMMWLQPIAMVLGVVMLSAISYVTLSTGERPFHTLREHVSPVLAWGWLIATMMANIVWCLPQFALGTAAIQQNLAPALDTGGGKYAVAAGLLVVASIVVWFYNSGSAGIKLFEMILKALVGIVVLSFFGVVAAMTMQGALNWGDIFAGMIPKFRYLVEPVPALAESIARSGEFSDWWGTTIAAIQKDRIITAFATAVGVNMSFLLPYSMLRKGWGMRHRGLAIFDLSLGLIIPFVLATGCVVIAAASQFHARSDDVLKMVAEGNTTAKEVKSYNKFIDMRLKAAEIPEQQWDSARLSLPEADKEIAAMLAERDNLSLAGTLSPLVGDVVAQKLFGIGVLGMALSTIIILMLINGFAFCELIGVPCEGTPHRIGSLIPAVGVVGPVRVGQCGAGRLRHQLPSSAAPCCPIAYFSVSVADELEN